MPTNVASQLGLVGVALGLTACGGDRLAPGAGSDPGTGTGTLAIEGSVHASPRQNNARVSTDFDAELSVRLALADQAVTTGTVTVTSASGKAPLTYRGDSRWTGTAASYDEVYVLDVMTGADQLGSVRVDGPDIHVFEAPIEGTMIDTTMALMIRWSHADQAERVELRGDSFDPIELTDSGAYSLASGSLKADKSGARRQTLRLLRTNRVIPSGATLGSGWEVTIENRVDVVAQPAPPLLTPGQSTDRPRI
jgi:hypothetical protein